MLTAKEGNEGEGYVVQGDFQYKRGTDRSTMQRELPPGLSTRDAKILKSVKRRAHYLDKGFKLCGMRFGWTFIIGAPVRLRQSQQRLTRFSRRDTWCWRCRRRGSQLSPRRAEGPSGRVRKPSMHFPLSASPLSRSFDTTEYPIGCSAGCSRTTRFPQPSDSFP